MSTRISTSKKIVNEILDKGLGNSSWRVKHENAYKELLDYREDLEISVRDTLIREHKRLIKSLENI